MGKHTLLGEPRGDTGEWKELRRNSESWRMTEVSQAKGRREGCPDRKSNRKK